MDNLLICQHCNQKTDSNASACSYCGMPVDKKQATAVQRRFVKWFIAIVIFCLFMIFWLPPDWLAHLVE